MSEKKDWYSSMCAFSISLFCSTNIPRPKDKEFIEDDKQLIFTFVKLETDIFLCIFA